MLIIKNLRQLRETEKKLLRGEYVNMNTKSKGSNYDEDNAFFQCCTSMDECIHSRRCFMTGEYCSKQNNIQKERNTLHKNEKSLDHSTSTPENVAAITAFVIMNFSDMSDVMYKWRIKSFVESLAPYFYVNKETNKVYCKSSKDDKTPDRCLNVNRIQVIRSDSDPVSNYVICSRICQQMQIADLIIVDVSSQNTNVFYEFGMAVALGKMILPICYSESFYEKNVIGITDEGKEVCEHHIGCYPWRKTLFEFYGIFYKNHNKTNNDENDDNDSRVEKYIKASGNENIEEEALKTTTHYMPFDTVIQKKYGFKDDAKYNYFPYGDKIEIDESKNKERLGKLIYKRLRDTYNKAKSDNNTLVVYTMDGFLNEEQAGRCIVNFYYYVVSRMKKEKCFCGDRVGVLVQGNNIFEEDKDSKIHKHLLYRVGEIVHIGVNQATYLALSEKIKTEEFLEVPECMKKESPIVSLSDYVAFNESKEIAEQNADKLILPKQKRDMIIFVKSYIRNRGMLVYPNYPIYVKRITHGPQKEVLKPYSFGENNLDFFCLYYVMLRTLKYTNEIVVDISGTDTQALFWLGAAHGSDKYAITVKHEKTTEEKERDEKYKIGEEFQNEGKERSIFDVSGLWTAILRSYNTEGFYRELAMAQIGIERHSRLMIKNSAYYETSIREFLSTFNGQMSELEMKYLQNKKQDEAMHVLESYYRRQFWNSMLRYNRLRLYLPQVDLENPNDNQPRVHAVKWDLDAIASLSHYLSKRTVIGEYRVQTLRRGDADDKAGSLNFICIGDGLTPLNKQSLSSYIFAQIDRNECTSENGCNAIHEAKRIEVQCEKCREIGKDSARNYKGFIRMNDGDTIYTQHPTAICVYCNNRLNKKSVENRDVINFLTKLNNVNDEACRLQYGDTHIQLAKLILWRDFVEEHGRTFYRVEINGSSGPATYGLSTLFVDDTQKKQIYTEVKEWKEHNLLCELQKRIRENLMSEYLRELKKELMKITWKHAKDSKKVEDAQRNRYISLVKHAISLYLSTVFYRYFFPFLSEEDIECICNSAENYVIAMEVGKVSPFAKESSGNFDPQYHSVLSDENVSEAAKKVITVLRSVLARFRGIEAFYQIKVKIDAAEVMENQDTRRLEDIKAIDEQLCGVSCLFAKDERNS